MDGCSPTNYFWNEENLTSNERDLEEEKKIDNIFETSYSISIIDEGEGLQSNAIVLDSTTKTERSPIKLFDESFESFLLEDQREAREYNNEETKVNDEELNATVNAGQQIGSQPNPEGIRSTFEDSNLNLNDGGLNSNENPIFCDLELYNLLNSWGLAQYIEYFTGEYFFNLY